MDATEWSGEGRERRKLNTSCPEVRGTLGCVVSAICCFLLLCTMGIHYTFGNINPYLTSYLRNRTGEPDIDYTDTLWISQTKHITTNALMGVIGLVANRIHTKLFLAIGIFFHAASLFGTYWTIQVSFPLVVLTYGVLHGVTNAIVYPATLKVAVEWVPEKKGFICGAVLMGYGLGSLTWNQMTTFFINPDNLSADRRVGEDVYYTQPEVLDNVPNCFLLLGTVLNSVQLICIFVMCLPPSAPELDPETSPPSEIKSQTIGSGKQITETSFTGQSKSYGSTAEDKSSEVVFEDTSPQYRPLEVLKSRVFWTFWLLTTAGNVGTAFVVSLFKAYGQTFINDDHFLTVVASVSGVFNAAGRPFWGLLADRIGYRMVFLITQCLLACLIATFVVCEQAGKVAFFFWVCAMFLVMCGYFTMVPVLMFALFGSRNFNVNMGLIDTHGVIGELLAALIAPVLKDTYGWHGMFYVGFGGMFAGVLLNLSLDIKWGNSIPEHMRNALSL